MLETGPAKKVTIYVGQDHQYHGDAVYAAILSFLFYHKVSGASATRGVAGFDADHHMQTDRILVLTANLPMKVEFIETPEKVAELLPKLYEMAGTGLIEIQDKALIESMRASEIAGVTVYQGILGYGANRRIHKDTALHLSHDRPMMLSVVDTEERLRAFLPVLDDMVQQGLVVFSDVDVIKYTHNYQEAERRKVVRS